MFKLVCIPLFVLAISFGMYFDLRDNTYRVAEKFIYNSDVLKAELGAFKISPILYNTKVKTVENDHVLEGNGTFGLILKGEKKYKEYEINVLKTREDSVWRVVGSN